MINENDEGDNHQMNDQMGMDMIPEKTNGA